MFFEQVKVDKRASAGRVVEVGRNGRLLGQVVQDRNEGGKPGAKSGAAQYQGGGCEGGVVTRRVKGTYP